MLTWKNSSDPSDLASNSAPSQRCDNGLNRSESLVSESQGSHEHSMSSKSWVGSESIVTGETEETAERPPLSGSINVDEEMDDPSVIGMDSPVDNYRESKASESKKNENDKSRAKKSFLWLKVTKQPPRAVDTVSTTNNQGRNGTRKACKVAVYASLVIVSIASVIILISYFATSSQAALSSIVSADAVETTTLDVAEEKNQEMMLLAERIIRACSDFDIAGDVECEQLCESHMCCFDENDETNCVTDENMDCAVHAACEALIEPDGSGRL